ncbi:hypothetical protein [Nonomuraea sp. NPDC049709]|uniref:hypothetical protein n=1 Tax=Nonomuraea sp. NPDC049709 TaxID=3154736 RepID=UPI00342E2792
MTIDPDFHDALERATSRGMYIASTVVTSAIDVLTAAIGLVAVAGVLGVLHPVLLPLLMLAVLPDAWAAVRAARMRYTTEYALIPVRRRKWIVGRLLAERDSAAEVRAFTTRGFLLRIHFAERSRCKNRPDLGLHVASMSATSAHKLCPIR